MKLEKGNGLTINLQDITEDLLVKEDQQLENHLSSEPEPRFDIVQRSPVISKPVPSIQLFNS